jgi:hypothetical protein
MAKNSKYIKLDKNVLLEYVYDSGNYISETYNILVDSRDRRQSYISSVSSTTGNSIINQLFKADQVNQKYSKVNPSYYSFLQLKEYAAGTPLIHDIIKIHIPINWTFGEYLGFYLRVYAFDTSNQRVFELSNFYFDMTDIDQQYLLNFTNPPLLFQEKLWGKNITIQIPSVHEVANQKEGNLPKPDSLNYNLTSGSGLSITSPIFIDFHFINDIKTFNGVTNYILSSKIITTVPQTPEFERLGLMIKHSDNGDFFEIYGTYNGSIAGFKQFMDESFNVGHRYYVSYNITMYEENIRGKTITVTQKDNFNEVIEYRPIIKYSTTTSIIDVEMRLIDAVDDSVIIRRASYGMLQDEVSKYSLRLIKINLSNANKPKIYNIKNNVDRSLVGISNSMGSISSAMTGRINQQDMTSSMIQIEKVEVPYPVLVDKFNIVGKSDNAEVDNKIFYGIGKITIILYPFDNIITFTIANGDVNSPDFLNMTSYGDIKLIFRNDVKTLEFPLFIESEMVNLANGQLVFKITENKFLEIKKIFESGVNVFYITSEPKTTSRARGSLGRTVIYSGLFKIYDNLINVAGLNKESAMAKPLIKEVNISKESAIVTRKPSPIDSDTGVPVRGNGSVNGGNTGNTGTPTRGNATNTSNTNTGNTNTGAPVRGGRGR